MQGREFFIVMQADFKNLMFFHFLPLLAIVN
jgi:hypothetical protein